MTREPNEELNDDPINELNRKIHEGEEAGNKLMETGRKLTESGQFMVDLSRAARDAVHVYQPVRHIEHMIHDLNAHNDQARLALANLEDTELPAFNSTAGTAAYTISGAFDPKEVQATVPEDQWPRINVIIARVHEVTSRMAGKEDVIGLMQALGLDASPIGHKSPLNLFITANDAFEKPVSGANPVSTSLIPMRESIRAAIDRLLKERPTQEKASNERQKIISIGSQLMRNSIPEEIIQSWADQWSEMLDHELSPAKQEDISREEWQYRLNQSVLFLKNFLRGIDPGKLRSSAK